MLNLCISTKIGKITVMWWLCPLRNFTVSFISYKNQETSIGVEFCYKGATERQTLYKFNFLFFRYGKNTKWPLQGDGRDDTVLELEVSSTKFNIPPCIWIKYWIRWERLKFWIKGSTLATLSDNIWSRLKSPKFIILYSVGS